MDVHLTKIWASPSTLHLRLLVTYKTHQGVQFADVHIPMDKIPSEVRNLIAISEGYDIPPGDSGKQDGSGDVSLFDS